MILHAIPIQRIWGLPHPGHLGWSLPGPCWKKQATTPTFVMHTGMMSSPQTEVARCCCNVLWVQFNMCVKPSNIDDLIWYDVKLLEMMWRVVEWLIATLGQPSVADVKLFDDHVSINFQQWPVDYGWLWWVWVSSESRQHVGEGRTSWPNGQQILTFIQTALRLALWSNHSICIENYHAW